MNLIPKAGWGTVQVQPPPSTALSKYSTLQVQHCPGAPSKYSTLQVCMPGAPSKYSTVQALPEDALKRRSNRPISKRRITTNYLLRAIPTLKWIHAIVSAGILVVSPAPQVAMAAWLPGFGFEPDIKQGTVYVQV
jgi:hypothetical protein